MKVLNVLVACEESQRVTLQMRRQGHNAFSCDIVRESGGHPEWHINADVLPLLNGECTFNTVDGLTHRIVGSWDMIIAFPPCTYLSTCCNRSFSLKCNPPEKVAGRVRKRDEAIAFFYDICNANCDFIAIENPVGYLNTHYRKPDQIIHPYFFGDPVRKRTCLWLKNLPKLEYDTSTIRTPEPLYMRSDGKQVHWVEGLSVKGVSRSKARATTFIGIARAMAAQWGTYVADVRKKNEK